MVSVYAYMSAVTSRHQVRLYAKILCDHSHCMEHVSRDHVVSSKLVRQILVSCVEHIACCTDMLDGVTRDELCGNVLDLCSHLFWKLYSVLVSAGLVEWFVAGIKARNIVSDTLWTFYCPSHICLVHARSQIESMRHRNKGHVHCTICTMYMPFV